MGDLHLLNMALAGLGIIAASGVVLALAIIGIAALAIRAQVTPTPAFAVSGQEKNNDSRGTATRTSVRRAA